MALYVSMGFTPVGREPDALLIEGAMYEDIHLVRILKRWVCPGDA